MVDAPRDGLKAQQLEALIPNAQQLDAMTPSEGATNNEASPLSPRAKTRIFVTGSCDGLDQLRDALERHGEIELVGTSVSVAESAGTTEGTWG